MRAGHDRRCDRVIHRALLAGPSGFSPQQRFSTSPTESVSTGRCNPTETTVWRGQTEDRGRVFDVPTEPLDPTEPISKQTVVDRANPAGLPCGSTSCSHRDRAVSEPRGKDRPPAALAIWVSASTNRRDMSDSTTRPARSASHRTTTRADAITSRSSRTRSIARM